MVILAAFLRNLTVFLILTLFALSDVKSSLCVCATSSGEGHLALLKISVA
ncbi:MAG: hypothetical protein ACXADA_13675 [Candidatus Hodarchaeales archaeon]